MKKLSVPTYLFLLGLAAWTSTAVAQIPGTFTPAGNMTTGRYGHTATLLANGKVLIAGGSSLPSAELYDPATGLFTATGNMTTARSGHFASLLPDGRVLIIGGDTFGRTSAEIYDSSTGIFTATGSTDRVWPLITATLLNNGKVLFIGEGLDPHSQQFVDMAELYDPSAGAFTATGALATHPYSPIVTLLPSGNVLVSDGGFGETCCNGNSPVPCCAAELYDPVAGTFNLTSNELLSSAFGRTATALMNGKVLLAGGLCDGCGVFSSAAVYDSSTGIFTLTGNMVTGRWVHTASLLPDGTVLMAGGEDFNYESLASAEIYDPRAGTFAAAGNMTSLRESHTATQLKDGGILITGGYSHTGTGSYIPVGLVTAELYNPAPVSFSGAAVSAGGGSGSVNLTLPADISWAASTAAEWISFTGPASGAGSGTLSYQVAANAGAGRSATITVAGISFTVEQQAASIPGLSLIGSMPHVAAEENWTTAFTLVNKGTESAVARLSLFSDSGETLTLPLGFPQILPAPLPLLASSLDRTLAANASLIIETSGPQVPPVKLGSAQVAAAGSVDGFAVFHNLISSQEAVVPLNTRNASSYLLAFDNMNGSGLGVAVENMSGQNANIPLVLRDDNGVQISLPGATMALPGSGHTSFDLAAQFPVTANKRGTIEFDAPAGGQVSVLGMRTTPLVSSNALTTIPALANIGANGGSFPHIAIGGGWPTTFVLVNTGVGAARAHLVFFDDGGNPLLLPLSFPQAGGVTDSMGSSVDRTLAAGATLIVQSSTPLSALATGSTQLTTDGNVGGFVIFRYNATGQEAAVPLENRNASAYLLAFDNTDGNATGVAVSSVSTQAVNVPAIVRDETGAQIAGGSIPLAANGHSAFTLAVDKFPETARIRGTIEFDTPPGSQISVVAIRIPPTHTFATLPAWVK